MRTFLITVAVCCCAAVCAPANASAGLCGVAGLLSGAAGKVCNVASHGSALLKAGKQAVTGHPGAAVKTVLGGGGSGRGGGGPGGGSGGGGSGSNGGGQGSGPKASTALALAAILTWSVVGAKFALHETAKVIGETTSPRLTTTWFSTTYWRIAGIAALLTMPFLFAAAVQALMRSDLSLLGRAALGYLPLSLLAVSIAAPVTMLLLAASDQMSGVVSAAAGNAGAHFFGRVGVVFGTLSLAARAPFLVFLAALLTAAAAIALWVEMLAREAAVYIVVLMLPLTFSAMVWPARRVWAVRTVELLVALILSKFAIVAVLSLGGAALGQTGSGGAAGMLTGLVLVLLAACAPWALVRLLPLAELASTAAGHLGGEFRGLGRVFGKAEEGADRGSNWAGTVLSRMREHAADAAGAGKPSEAPAATPGWADQAARESGGSAGPDGGGEAARASEGTPGPDGGGEAARPPDGPAGPAGPAAGPGHNGPAAEAPPPPERSPGMDPIWQAPDLTLPPIVLGREQPSHRNGSAGGTEGVAEGPGAEAEPPPDDQHSLPQGQEPGDGRL